MCLQGASGAGAELMAAIPDASLRAHFVWVPMLPSDSEQAAVAASAHFAEARTTHYLDGERHLARRMSPALGIDSRTEAAVGDVKEFAWDVYLAYRRGNTHIATPDFWMHQLAVTHAPPLEASEWRRRVQMMLDS
jgi:hypothetical protein